MSVFRKTVSRVIAAITVALAVVSAVGVLPAQAASQQLTPFRCFTQDKTIHVVFGPLSFFLPPRVQGPTSFRENAGPTVVSYPLYRGTSQGRSVDYVITDASTLSAATVLGVNYVPKLAQAVGTAAVQTSRSTIRTGNGNGIDFPASVDFSPPRIIVPDPATGFPPTAAQPGAVGEPGYSPLVLVHFLGGPVVLNAPQIANASGQADKVISIDAAHHSVKYQETDGCYDNESVHYASFDASDPVAAAIEDVTYAPNLAAAPSNGCADPAVVAANCSRESLIAFINGQTGTTNPQRQGLNAALLDGHSPLNILKEIPEPTARFDYSPLWDIHLVHWNDSVPVASRLRQTDFATAQALVGTQAQSVTPAGLSNTFQATGFVVNCPVVSLDVNPNR
jgi:hypothetical protein